MLRARKCQCEQDLDRSSFSRSSFFRYSAFVRVLTASDFLDMPWKNGGGRTLQLAIHPPGATLETFDWRVSIATVERSGPFSAFPGCTRTLMLLDGDGFELDIAGRRVVLDRPLEPVTFSGDDPVSCRLLGGPSHDFGVITRNGRAKASITIERIHGQRQLAVRRGMVVCLSGSVQAAHHTLESVSALEITDDATLAVNGAGVVAVASIP